MTLETKESPEKTGERIAPDLALLQHEEREHYLERMPRQTLDVLFEGGQAAEGALEGFRHVGERRTMARYHDIDR